MPEKRGTIAVTIKTNVVGPQPSLDLLMAEEFGNRAGLLLDHEGTIIAVNEAASRLLGIAAQQLVGSSFGLWGSLSDEMYLDVTQSGHSVVVRAERFQTSKEDPYIPISLRQLPEQSLSLYSAATSSILDACDGSNHRLQDISFGEFPSVMITHEAQQLISRAIGFLKEVSGARELRLKVNASLPEPNLARVLIELDIRQVDDPIELNGNITLGGLLDDASEGAWRILFDYKALAIEVDLACFR